MTEAPEGAPTELPATGQVSERIKRLMEAMDKWTAAMPFVAYSPFLTYSDSSNKVFLDQDGRPIHKHADNPDAEAILRIGRDAYALLNIRDRNDFRERYERFKKTVKHWRNFIEELASNGRLTDQDGEILTPEALQLGEREASEILSMAWGIVDRANIVVLDHDDALRAEDLAFACLREVDNVLVGTSLDGRAAVSSAIFAVNALANAQACLNGSAEFRKVRKKMASEAAMARHRSDPKQADKRFVFSCYKEWRESPARYRSKAAFARDMLQKCEHLESQKKIEDWVREWDSAATDGTLPAG